MSNLEINGKNASNTTFIPLADDDRVWLHETRSPRDLIDLITDPFAWVGKIQVVPAAGEKPRPARLSDNFMISMEVSTAVGLNANQAATYVVDGIDSTGYISIRMMTPGGRFNFKSGIDFDAVEKKILALNPEFVIAHAGERGFVHLPLGTDVDLKIALMCAAIENQDWLCALYEKLDLHLLDKLGNKSGLKKIKFKLPGSDHASKSLLSAPHLNILYHGSRPTQVHTLAPSTSSPTTAVDACNANAGTLIQNTFYLDTFVIKAYAPLPPGP